MDARSRVLIAGRLVRIAQEILNMESGRKTGATISQIVEAFASGKPARGNSSMYSTGDKLFSYSTVLMQRLSDGTVVANVTRYSVTTSQQRNKALRIIQPDICVDNIPRGESDLQEYVNTNSVNCG